MIDPVHKKVVLHTGSSQITIDSQGVKVQRQSLEKGAPQQQQNNSHHSLMRAQQLQESRHNYQNPSFVSSTQGSITAQEASYNKYNKTNNHGQFINSNGMSGGGGANQANVSLSQRFSQIVQDKNKVSSMLPRQQHVEVVQNNECELQKSSRNPAFSRSNPLEKSEKPSPQIELLSLARQIVRRAQETQQPGYKERLVIQKSSLDNPNENTQIWIHEQQQQNESTSPPTQEQLQHLYRNQTSKSNKEQTRFYEQERSESESEESETEQEQDNREDDNYDDCEDSEEYSEDCQSPNQIQIEEEEESQSEPEVNDDQSDEENYIHMNYPFMPALPEDLEFDQNSYNDPETFDQEYEPNDESFDGTGGLTKAEFLSLPSIVYTSQPIRLKQSKYSSQQDCSICLSHYQDNEILCVLPCEHRFHRNCIDKWLKLNSKCVICKHDLIS